MNKYHYLLIMLLTLYLIVMYHAVLPVLLLLVELLLPLLLYLLLIPVTKRLQCRFGKMEDVYETGERMAVELWVQNPPIIPVVNLHLELQIQNLLTTEKEHLTLSAMVPAKGTIKLPLAVSSRYCGRVRIRVEKMYVWDFFRMFRKKKKGVLQTGILLIPSLEPISMEVSNQVRAFLADCDLYDSHEKGSDPAEVFLVREYQPGDRMQQVHWKLSVAKDTMLVKELSKPLLHPVVVMVSFHVAEPWVLQQMISEALSLCWSMLQNDCPSDLVCRTPKGEPQKLSLTEEEDLMPCIESVFAGIAPEEEEPMVCAYEELYPNDRYAHCIYLTDQVNEEQMEQLSISPLAQKYTVVCLTNENMDSLQALFETNKMELLVEKEGEELVLHRHWLI